MELIKIIVSIAVWALFVYLTIAVGYMLVFAVAGWFRKQQNSFSQNYKRMAVLIPAYKEDAVILEVASKATKQDYPSGSYDVFVIADSLQDQTLHDLRSLPIQLIKVSFDKSTKSKALNRAMDCIDDSYDIAVVLDADNIMAADFLRKVNNAFDCDFHVVQGRRVAKNHNTSFAILDGVSEAINNHIFRLGHRGLGLSSGLVGSGMAFNFSLFKAIMNEVQAVGGFDKELEFRLFQEGYKIEYLNDALVYDEKIQNPADFNNQRRRWLSTNLIYFRRFFWTGLRTALQKGNIDIVDKLFQMILLPRILLLGLVFICSFIHLALSIIWPESSWLVQPQYWHILSLLVLLTFLISIPRMYYSKETLSACLSAPRAFVIMFLLLFRLKGANKEFIHTEHHSAGSQSI